MKDDEMSLKKCAKEMGSAGGKARGKKLSPSRRKEIASKAGKAGGKGRRKK